jgi:hypothetical protein
LVKKLEVEETLCNLAENTVRAKDSFWAEKAVDDVRNEAPRGTAVLSDRSRSILAALLRVAASELSVLATSRLGLSHGHLTKTRGDSRSLLGHSSHHNGEESGNKGGTHLVG